MRIVFQYFTIAPMRGLSLFPGIWAAIKADTLSITAWQLGMYGWMLLTCFVLFPHPHRHPNQAGYWFMMQFAMIAGFLTAFPMNWILVKSGLKDRHLNMFTLIAFGTGASYGYSVVATVLPRIFHRPSGRQEAKSRS